MNKFLLFAFFAFFWFWGPLRAQETVPPRGCTTYEVNQAMLRSNPAFALKQKEIEAAAGQFLQARKNLRTSAFGDTITVVFHVLYNKPEQNISDAQLYSQLQVLNEDFNRQNADTINTPAPFLQVSGNPKISFCLASLDPEGNSTTGITRTFTNKTSFSATNNQMKFTNQGGKDGWRPELYLNIWVCNLGGDVLGFAQFPGLTPATDGVVLRYSSIGRFPFNTFPGRYTSGRTATHEIGHWLGLRHIWGDDGDDCTGTDLIDDTPNQGGQSSGCPAYPKVSCNNEPFGDMFMNFMDYTVDNCMNLFTRGQSEKMNAILQTSRRSLLASNMCSNKLNADFRAEPDAIFPGETTNFYYYSNGRKPTSFFWTFEGATPGTSTERDPKNIRYDNPGPYTVTLTVSDGTASDTETKVGYLKVTSRELQLYPNPADAFVTVAGPASTKLARVWIYSLSGKLLFEATLNERTLEVNTRSFPNGLYLARAATDNGRNLGQLLLINR